MEGSFDNISREILEDFIDPETDQAIFSHYSQYIPQAANPEHVMPQIAGRNAPLDTEPSTVLPDNQGRFSNVVLPETTHTSINITRREILTLTSVLERIPREYVLE